MTVLLPGLVTLWFYGSITGAGVIEVEKIVRNVQYESPLLSNQPAGIFKRMTYNGLQWMKYVAEEQEGSWAAELAGFGVRCLALEVCLKGQLRDSKILRFPKLQRNIPPQKSLSLLVETPTPKIDVHVIEKCLLAQAPEVVWSLPSRAPLRTSLTGTCELQA
ncbi:hypothetical protein HYALB_00009659 [Hymenoscyphus albidus]|uniref:Uncharacterized protein n=1 Tax=Hymenoscyphus albidus TaxID=595503 RepID=A0A9N9PZ79_9HELO|nr:hypothetical protein HYALB_00009659 [Hymenoscyphus albidus]